MDKSTNIKVLNRDNGAVVYSIPEMNGLTRVFQSGETKEVTFEELQKLSYIPGGMELLKDSLLILDNKAAIQELIGEVELEYSYTKEDIINLMKNGSLDEFLDCLDFAPGGVKDLIKTLAVELPLNDIQKRDAIKTKLGYDVSKIIEIKNTKFDGQKDEEENKSKANNRRVDINKPSTPTATGRRYIAPNKG